MNILLNMIEVNQPIGTFYLGKISAQNLVKISFSNLRKENQGIQRELKTKRTKEIQKYSQMNGIIRILSCQKLQAIQH